MIKAENLIKRYGKRTVVDEISIDVNRGEIVGLLGPNGAGKTTTFYMIVGLVKPNGGSVLLNGHNVLKMPMYKRARLGLGYLPQEASIFKKLTVEENVVMLWEIIKNVHPNDYEKRLSEIFEDLGLTHLRKSLGVELSGGERRRVEIARLLAMDPDFILLDEPFAGIDPIAVEEIQTIIKRLKEKNFGILITDHNVRETLSLTDRAYIVYNGKILLQGDSEKVANDPVAKKLYLGEAFELS